MAAKDVNPQTLQLGDFQSAVSACLEDWREGNKVRRLWRRDSALWSGGDEAKWLGWLDVAPRQLANGSALDALQRAVVDDGVRDVVVLGMGGSSLAPEVFSLTYGQQSGYPRLRILDSTVPAQIARLDAELDLASTLFVVASKSGSTAEPNAFESYFFDKVGSGEHFVAITDPGSALEAKAREKHYKGVYPGEPAIGGRFSALSNFGMVPAAAMGVAWERFLLGAERMAQACGANVPPAENPGVELGVALGVLARAGRDKLTLLATPRLRPLGAWIEQLVAESTGKNGKGILPVDDEPPGVSDAYGDDRVFVQLDVDAVEPPAFTTGHPLIRIRVPDLVDLGQEFFRWEIATAVAGSVLELNPFDQPDVEAAKIKTRSLVTRFESGELAHETGAASASDEAIRAHLERLQPGDYFAIMAYLDMSAENQRLLQSIRARVRDAKGVATTLGFGPRFLHSTGQLHKGGSNRGVFLQLTADDDADFPIPGQRLTFGQLNRFQAQGDLEVLEERDRRVARMHLGSDVSAGLERLASLTSLS
jgi:transaldolase/glucose-6-phosphate isomerase